MDKRERVKAAILGKPVDRVPVSAWGHDFGREWSAQGLAQATLEAYRQYDWDFIKVNPRATYYGEAWGSRFEPHPSGDEGPRLIAPAVTSPGDLARISPLPPDAGPLGEQLEALQLIAQEVKGEVFIVQTVFNPLAVLSQLTGSLEATKRLMLEVPEEVEGALDAIAVTLARYSQACLKAGADGIFLATVGWGSRKVISPAAYGRFGRPYDLMVLAAVADAPFNILHVCRDYNLLPWLLDYPVSCFHWAVHAAGNPSLQEVLARVGRAVVGGVNQEGVLVQGPPQEVFREARQAIEATGGRRFLLAPGCSVPPKVPKECLLALRQSVEVGG